MERMNYTNNYDSRLWRLLEEEKLADLSQYHQPGFFDEVPLYSREADVDFLPDDDKEATAILLRFALRFMKSVVAYESHRAGYVAAITVWDFSDAPIVPNLFVWCDSVRKLEKKLMLKPVTTSFGKEVKKLISGLKREGPFDILEDASTLSERTRVFIALARAPYQGFVTLDHFRRRARAVK